MQEHGGHKFPVYYASKKLLERKRAYAVVDKECLTVDWAVNICTAVTLFLRLTMSHVCTSKGISLHIYV